MDDHGMIMIKNDERRTREQITDEQATGEQTKHKGFHAYYNLHKRNRADYIDIDFKNHGNIWGSVVVIDELNFFYS